MKKQRNIAILMLATLIFMLFALAVVCVNAIFPKAPPITCPNPVNSPNKEKNIISIHVSHNGDSFVKVNNDDIGLVTQHIPYAKPTRRWSVNEVPTAEDYYTIEIAAASRTYLYHLYAEDSQVYIEDPYDGVYTIDGAILDIVVSYFID